MAQQTNESHEATKAQVGTYVLAWAFKLSG
jgi:hypothetical protein